MLASAVFAVVVCSSVRPSQASVVTKLTGRIELILAWRLLSTYSTLIIGNFEYLQKSQHFPLELYLKLRTRKFRNGKLIMLSSTLVVVVDGQAC